MNWWTSIVYYLWQNSINRCIEQPLGVVSKLAIAALIGTLGAVMMLGAIFLGDELHRQLVSRDALAVQLQEVVSSKRAGHFLDSQDDEDAYWKQLSNEVLILYRLQASATRDRRGSIPIYAMKNPEQMGYPDTLLLITKRVPQGVLVPVNMDTTRALLLAMPPIGPQMETLANDGELVLGSTKRLVPLLKSGFTRHLMLQAKSLAEIERMQAVVDVMKVRENRRIYMNSSLPLLLKIREISVIQKYILVAVTLGSALTLGLICGALAWMEFREERYLLALIRSFGVGRRLLLAHAVVENCLVSIIGVLLGIAVVALAAVVLQGGVLNLAWLDNGQLMSTRVLGVLMAGALMGGLLSCLPIAIGLKTPIGLILK